MSKVIITVVGKDTVGIIAKVCTYLAGKQVNILDISQTIVQDYFNMMMIADMEHATGSFAEVEPNWRKSAKRSAYPSSASARKSSPKCTVFNQKTEEKRIQPC